MKKFYILGMALMGFSLNAQFVEDFEGYDDGEEVVNIDPWTTWSGGVNGEGIIVTSAYAYDGFQSGMIGGGEVQDAILKLGNKTSGIWTVEQHLYIPNGSSGYFNFQEDEDVASSGGIWGVEFYFGYVAPDFPDNNSFLVATDASGSAVYLAGYDHPYDEWFTLTNVFDMAAGTVRVLFNGTEIYNGDAYLESFQLGGIDYFSADPSNQLYIDAITFVEGEIMSVDDAESISSISVYPTVANEVINVSAKSNISEVSVFNTAGQQVAKVAGNGTSAQVNVSALPAGVYVVRTVAGKEVKSTKVVVK